MAVITPLDREQIESFLLDYPNLSQLSEFKPTLNGIENTNYFLTLQQPGQTTRRCVLTLFEQLSPQQLPFYSQLQQTLADESLPVPAPIANQYGKLLAVIENKPAIIFPRLSGQHPEQVSAEQCCEIGTFLGKMHRISTNAENESAPTNPNNLSWMQTSRGNLAPYLSPKDQQLLNSELDEYQSAQPAFEQLPSGIIHADLFRDNALFDGDKLSGVIDFYNACKAPLLYDLAVVANDWCRSKGEFDSSLTDALLEAYQQQRTIEQNEKEIWPMMLRFAACRFWLSRLLSCYPAIPDKPNKNPEEFRSILIQRIQSPGDFEP